MRLSFKQLFYVVASLFGLAAVLFVGRTVLVPLAFSLLVAFILYPMCVWLERKGVSRMWSIIWTMLTVTLVIAGAAVLFSAQIISISKEFGNFTERLNSIMVELTNFINTKFSILPDVEKDNLVDKGLEWISSKSGGILTNTLNSTALFFTGLTLTLIYTFLILLYRKGLKRACASFAKKEKQEKYVEMVGKIQKIGQQYLTGMFTLILVLGCLNSLGLFILGIDYALFFGFLAAFLAIIPYVGTTIGGAIPAVYAFMTYDSHWYALGVILIFWFVQILEGNFLSPKIVGGNLNVNALAAIMALIAGGAIWGVAGMVLFLPYTAILKVVSEYYKELQPVSLILKDDLYEHGDGLKKKMSKILTNKSRGNN